MTAIFNIRTLLFIALAGLGLSLAGLSVTTAEAQERPRCEYKCNDDKDDTCKGILCDDYIPPKPEECIGDDCGPVIECQTDCGPGGDSSTPTDDSIPGNQAGLVQCDAKLANLAKVTARQIRGVKARDTVVVMPVCESMNLMRQQKGVEDLRSAIAENDRMEDVLGRHGLSAAAVVGIRFSRGGATLYVHAL